MKLSNKACQNIAKSLVVKVDSPYLAAGMGLENAKLMQLATSIIKEVFNAIEETEVTKIKAASKIMAEAKEMKNLIQDLTR